MDLLQLLVFILVLAGIFWFIHVVIKPSPRGEQIIGGVLLLLVVLGLLSFAGILSMGWLHYKPAL